jgi:hypothetical protein
VRVIVMRMRWEGATPEQYDRMRDKLDWVADPPDGGIQHVAWFDEGGMNIVDVWESEEKFNAFIQSQVMPAVQELGIPGQPDVQIDQAHAVNEGLLAKR